ncbi:hypothetical protein VT84_06655 [Gemmata sp. SH-PL17]|uniref:hypothetical protein n=1 Tax=Gemmata sp. SH-PL17 TaxID=1630693 RepID=UPI00078E7769|nr:hypothetical protein [Gemmata sp. SH-PL17]AMV24058.1 hypothetical protein VT84_06655 [Gemmata sp. SH-PL17]
MNDTVIAAMVVSVVGVTCFGLTYAVLGILSIWKGNSFSGTATEKGVNVTSAPNQVGQ